MTDAQNRENGGAGPPRFAATEAFTPSIAQISDPSPSPPSALLFIQRINPLKLSLLCPDFLQQVLDRGFDHIEVPQDSSMRALRIKGYLNYGRI